MTSQDSGNTTPSSFRARAFLLTLNEVDKFDTLLACVQKLKSCDYYIACREIAPTTGHEHIHMYLHFESNYKLNKKIMNTGVHVDITRGSPKQCIDYVKKGGNIICEHGTEPHQGRAKTIKELRDTPLDEVEPIMFNVWKQIQPQKIKKEDWHKDIDVIYISGPSGSGKSKLAHDYADDEFDEVKYRNNFWNGISDGTGCCIYDDFRCSDMPAAEFINFIDYNVHNLNIKGSNIKNRYNKIIITSIQPLDEIYNNMKNEAKQQWLRRIQWINIAPPITLNDEDPLLAGCLTESE